MCIRRFRRGILRKHPRGEILRHGEKGGPTLCSFLVPPLPRSCRMINCLCAESADGKGEGGGGGRTAEAVPAGEGDSVPLLSGMLGCNNASMLSPMLVADRDFSRTRAWKRVKSVRKRTRRCENRKCGNEARRIPPFSFYYSDPRVHHLETISCCATENDGGMTERVWVFLLPFLFRKTEGDSCEGLGIRGNTGAASSSRRSLKRSKPGDRSRLS